MKVVESGQVVDENRSFFFFFFFFCRGDFCRIGTLPKAVQEFELQSLVRARAQAFCPFRTLPDRNTRK